MNRLVCLSLLIAFTGMARANEGRPALLEHVGIEQRLNAQLPLDAVFRDETGHAVQLGQYLDKKPVILTLVYYECPMLCTLVLNGLVSALNVLSFDVGTEFDIVTVSFNPHDTPALAAAKKDAVLQHYGRPAAARGWHFLTGDAAAIARLADAVGFRYAYDSEHKQYAHAAGLMVITPQGRIARYFYGVEYAPRDLRLALIEAADNRIGSPVDQLLLFCFHYDPATGKYGPVVMNLVRAGGVLTVLALVGFILIMRRRDMHQPRPPDPRYPLATNEKRPG